MITKHSHASVYVIDQDRAKAFYTEKLGLEVRDDVRIGELRWLTVAPRMQTDGCIVLRLVQPGPTLTLEQAAQLRELVEGGAFAGGVLQTDDCRRDYEQFMAKGVEFMRAPTEIACGMEALMRDDSGNLYSLTQPGHDGDN